MKKASIVLLLCWLAVAAYAAPQAGLLPREFAGWQKSATSSRGPDPAQADPANAALLKEYGFSDFEQATYTRPGRKITLKAARFNDTSGAYGAFTFYKQPQMLRENIGEEAASADTRVLFHHGNVLVDARLDRVTAMSAAELRELASALPLVRGNALNPPNLPGYLPKSYERNSVRYVVGPVGLSEIGSPIPASLVNFNTGAEVALGRYHTGEGEAAVMVIGYPTPQIAVERARAIESSMGGKNGGVYTKRTGPYVVAAAGRISAGEAKSLLASVNYDADVTWNENTFFSKRDNLGSLLVGVILLAGILMGAALILGIFFGGFRLLMRRMFPDRVFGRSKDGEIISLGLGE